MTKRLLILSLSLLSFGVAFSQTAFTAQEGAQVFVPQGFDASQHLPSPVFLRELVPQTLSVSTSLQPQFSREGDKSVISVDTRGADLYGTGEVYGPLRRNGDHNIFWNRDNGAFAAHRGKELYQTHPWVLGLRQDGTAFGILFESTWRSRMELGDQVRFISDGPLCRVVVLERETPEEVLGALARLSGTMELPPLWALGYQQCRFSYYPDSRVREVAAEFRTRRIPCDVIWLDIHYMDGYRIFTFDPKRFPDPKGLMDDLHKDNFKCVCMIDPGAKVDPDYFVDQQGMQGDYYVHDSKGKVFEGNMWPGNTHWPDFSRPEVRLWWSTLYRPFMQLGIDGIWNDVNEPTVFGGGEEMTMPDDNIHLGGDGLEKCNHVRYHNLYGYDMVRASRDGILSAHPDKRPFVLSRSGFLGVQRYAATWTGDNVSTVEQMKASVPMTLNMGLSLQPFNGPDIGGFLSDCNPELLRQWTAMGVYFPFVRNHSCDGTVNQEPWAFDPQTEEVCRRAIERRYMFLPYIYTLFEEASRTGKPVMRPLFWSDFRDASLREEQEAFLLGSDLLIVPAFATHATLPKGDWDIVQFENGTDQYQANVALRPGAIVPMACVAQNTEEYSVESLTLVVNPDCQGEARGEMYEDAGNGFSYRTGEYSRLSFQARTEGKNVIVSWKQTEGNMPSKVKRIRAALVADGKISYSQWSETHEVELKSLKDSRQQISLTDMHFREMKTIDDVKNQPISFTAWLRPTLWGGHRLHAFKNLKHKDETIGESWEISAVEGHESVVADGEYKGKTISQLCSALKADFLGESVFEKYGERFPLLVKFIAAEQDLSVQVHPDDATAKALGETMPGKSEMWYVCDAAPGSYIYNGLKHTITPEEFDSLISQHRITDVLVRHEAEQGAVYDIPAGRIHALGAGLLIAEIQQTSDLTYRIYDYNRLGTDLKMRELHLDKARKAIDYTKQDGLRTQWTWVENKPIALVQNEKFKTELIFVDGVTEKSIASLDSFVIVVCTEGEGSLNGRELRRGETLLLPAKATEMRLLGKMTILTAYCE